MAEGPPQTLQSRRMPRSWLTRAFDRLAVARPWVITLLVSGLTSACAMADWLSRAEVAASLAYLLPISLAAWCLGRVSAAITATCSAALWLAVDIQVQGSGMDTTNEVINLTVLFVAFMLFGQLLSALRDRLDMEHQLATTDALTGIHNLRAFRGAAERELERCRRHGQPFTLAYLDLDNFKAVNDRFGHARGDELLRQVAQTMRASLRRLDMAARLGGDEFAVLLPGTGSLGAAILLARLSKNLHNLRGARGLGVGMSIGGLTVLDPPESLDALIAHADRLMYAIKNQGRGAVRHEVLDNRQPRMGPGVNVSTA